MTCKFCGSPLPDGAMICDLCGNNQKASKPVEAFSFGAAPAQPKKGKPADRWNTGPSASMEGASMDDVAPVAVKPKKSRGSFPVKKLLVVRNIIFLFVRMGCKHQTDRTGRKSLFSSPDARRNMNAIEWSVQQNRTLVLAVVERNFESPARSH